MIASPEPLISVALCTYNGTRFLKEQLDSLISQDYPKLEIVAVDDGSSDGTPELLQEYSQRDTRVRIYRNPVNLGFLKNFERALDLCKGELIATCDQDDIWHSTKLSVLQASLGDSLLVYCDSEMIDDRGNSLNRRISDVVNMYAGSDPKVFALANSVAGHAMVFRRELLRYAKPFPECGYHDWWLAFVAASVGRIVYTDQCLVRYRRHDDSQTQRIKQKKTRTEGGAAFFRHIYAMERWLAAIKSFEQCPDHSVLERLHRYWVDRYERFLCPGLFRLMLRYRGSFFFLTPVGPLGRIRLALRYFWGIKTKRLFNPKKYAIPAPADPRLR